ncbi:hypothetical protein COV82_06710 [Candidatus Peregrinibacteria bacterium CG11_big_fil_rev_8_21_14_0_20_46_8]|nr:MAG: hypothetical protein COV82_06710 [Candidatus Peregrinibacteria bacterium CG11_big_fil_rev_8_21_14_0_20_46_8]
MKRLFARGAIIGGIIGGILISVFFAPVALAQGIVPSVSGGFVCDSPETAAALRSRTVFQQRIQAADGRREALANHLGCAIKTGDIRLFMLPFFVTYLVQFLLQIAGVVALLFIVLGGYYYVIGGLTEDKEKGKKTLMHAIVGLIIALSAWIIVNFIQVALTS